jgi:hypothetical protein
MVRYSCRAAGLLGRCPQLEEPSGGSGRKPGAVHGDIEKRAVGKQPLRICCGFAAQHDAHIYTNDGSKLARSVSRESTQRTATEVERQLLAPRSEATSARNERPGEQEQSHSLGVGL